jgi:hypothetical protein
MHPFSTCLVLAGAVLCAQAPAPSAQEILDRAKAAMGGAAWDRVEVLECRGTLHASGLDGTLHSLEDLRTGREVDSFDLGAVRGANGRDERADWERDETGDVKADESVQAHRLFLNARFNTMRAYWYPARAAGTVGYLGLRAEGGRSYHVLEVRPEGGLRNELWVDAGDWTLARTVAVLEGRAQTTFFEDYRTVDGIRVPFRTRSSQGDATFETRIQLQSVVLNPHLEPAAWVRPKPDLGRYGLEGGPAPCTLPVEMRSLHFLVQVRLNGKGPYRFFLDTGGQNVLSPARARELGLAVTGSLQGGGVGEQDEAFGMAKVARVELGSAWMADQSFIVVPAMANISTFMGVEVSGVVGYELFRRFVARIEGLASGSPRLTLALPEQWSYHGSGIRVPFRFNGTQPQVAGELDGIPGRFDLDTGSNATLDVYTPFAQEHRLRARAQRSVHTVTGAGVGGEVWGDVVRARELRLGGAAMFEPIVTLNSVTKGKFASEGVAGNVGLGFLKRFDLILDYPHQTIIFERNASWGERDNFSMTGIQPYPDPSGRIRQVYPGSAAEAAGLKAEDVVLTVNGSPFQELFPDRLRALALAPAGTRLTLTVRSGTVVREVILVLRAVL